MLTAAPIVVANNIWAIADVNLSGGTNSIRAFQTNLAGTTSKVSTALTIMVQTPGGFDLAANDDSGLSKSDNITNKSSGLTISGTAFSGGKSVTLFVDGDQVATATVSKGLWKTDISLSHKDTPYVITASQTNADGSSSEPSIPFSLTVDRQTPGVITDMAVAGGIELADNKGYLSNKTTGLVVSGTGGDPGAQVALLENGKSIGSGFVDGDGKWGVTVAKFSNGTHNLKAQQTDLAGNVGLTSTTVLMISIDSVAPAVPTSLRFNKESSVISGKGEREARLTLFNDSNNNSRVDDGEQLGEVVSVDASKNWSTAVDLPAGQYANIRAMQSDLAGNVSKASSALSITIAAAGLTRALQGYSSPAVMEGVVVEGVALSLTEGQRGDWLSWSS
ncbi:MAG: hypothetical protein HQL60_09310 [Magnetococcales bacterium]|nr:hypothetical protein [Magnetococcales bacterium]